MGRYGKESESWWGMVVAGLWALVMVMTFTVRGGLGAATPTTIAPPEMSATILPPYPMAVTVTTREAVGGQPSPLLSIAQARRWRGPEAITLTGWVTVPSGQFASAMLDQGFALQDQSGGLYISTQELTDFAVGEQIRVVGTVGDDGHGQRILQLRGWQRLPPAPAAMARMSGGTLTPMPIAGAQDLEGQLVAVQGRVSRPLVVDAPYGDRLWLADDSGEVQIYMPRSTHLRPEELPFLTPGQPLQVTGLISQYDGNHEVIPRFHQDLQPRAIADGD